MELQRNQSPQYRVFDTSENLPEISISDTNKPIKPPRPRKKKNQLADSIQDTRERYKLLYAAIDAIPDSRVSVCRHVAALNPETMGSKSVRIGRNSEGEVSFMDAAVCGSVWLCPVCFPRIARQRQMEMRHALKKNRENGGAALMLTTTFSHKRHDVLAELLTKFSKGLSDMKGCRRYKNIKNAIGYIGSIRAMEFTHSNNNGWHPHTHEVIFLKEPITVEQAEDLRKDVFDLWREYALKHGLGEPNEEHGIDVKYSVDPERNDDLIADYLAGLDYELTHLHTKESKQTGEYGGRSPWDILKAIAASKGKNERDIFLWKQFANAVHGRRQLFWSPGLKELFGVKEFSDQEAAESFEEKVEIRKLDDEEFYLMCRARKHAVVLEIARLSPIFLDRYFIALKRKYHDVLVRRRMEKRERDEWCRANSMNRYQAEKAARVYCMVTGR